MKIFIVDCSAEELRANRTIMDCLNDVLRTFTGKLVGSGLTGLNGSCYVDEPVEEEADVRGGIT